MNIKELIKQNEIYFLDIETVGGAGICQIGITKWDLKTKRLSVVFNQIINPDVPSKDINMYAMKVHNISEYTWASAKPYSFFHAPIRNLLQGKTVLQWGGSDIGIINKNIIKYNLKPIDVTSLNSWAYHFKGVKLTLAAQNLKIGSGGFHDAAYDSYVTALLFVCDMLGYQESKYDSEILDRLKSEKKTPKVTPKETSLKKTGSGEDVCLTGFTSDEKKRFGEMLTEKGFKIRSIVTQDLKFLITPSLGYGRSPSKEAEASRVGAQVIDLNSFLMRSY